MPFTGLSPNHPSGALPSRCRQTAGNRARMTTPPAIGTIDCMRSHSVSIEKRPATPIAKLKRPPMPYTMMCHARILGTHRFTWGSPSQRSESPCRSPDDRLVSDRHRLRTPAARRHEERLLLAQGPRRPRDLRQSWRRAPPPWRSNRLRVGRATGRGRGPLGHEPDSTGTGVIASDADRRGAGRRPPSSRAGLRYLHGRIDGVLEARSGCVFVEAYEDRWLLLWPEGYSA